MKLCIPHAPICQDFAQKYGLPALGEKVCHPAFPESEGYESLEVVGYSIVLVHPCFPNSVYSVEIETETFYNANLDKDLALPAPDDKARGSLWWILPVFDGF